MIKVSNMQFVKCFYKLHKKGYFSEHRTPNTEHRAIRIVCVLTGHGLKDPDRAIKTVKEPEVVDAKPESVVKVMEL